LFVVILLDCNIHATWKYDENSSGWLEDPPQTRLMVIFPGSR